MTAFSKTAKDLPQLPTELVEQLASFVKTEQDLSLITNQLMKQVVEKALQAELSHHLALDSATGNANSRNGFMGKTLKGHTWTPTFAKLSFNDFKLVKIAAIHSDFK